MGEIVQKFEPVFKPWGVRMLFDHSYLGRLDEFFFFTEDDARRLHRELTEALKALDERRLRRELTKALQALDEERGIRG